MPDMQRRSRATNKPESLPARFVAFGINAIVSSLLPILVLTVIVRVDGVSAFGEFALGQGVGSMSAVIINYGWPIFGPTLIARTPVGSRPDVFAESLAMRLWLSAPVTLAAFAFMATIGQVSPISSISLVAASTVGLVATWYLIGAGNGRRFIALDTLPRLAGGLSGAAFSFVAESIWPILIGLLVGSVMAPVFCCIQILKGRGLTWSDFRLTHTTRGIREHFVSAASGAVTTLYVTFPILILGWVNPGAVAAFSAGQRMQKLAVSAITPGLQVLQGWVPDPDVMIFLVRLRRSLVIASLSSVSLGFISFSVLPTAMEVTSGGKIAVDLMSRVAISVLICCIAMSQVTGLVCLAALKQMPRVFKSVAAGAVVAVFVVPIAAIAGGVGLVWVSLALSEVIVLVYQMASVRAAVRQLVTDASQDSL